MDVQNLKEDLGYAWCDAKTESQLARRAAEALSFLQKYNPDLDPDKNPGHYSLMLEYVRYATANKLFEFKDNYQMELMSLHDEYTAKEQDVG